jgi:hypothetical protein
MKFIMPRAPRFTWTRFGWLLALIVAVNCGCSGINASQAISPLNFLLPGLLQNDPPRPVIPASTNTLVCWDGRLPSPANR